MNRILATLLALAFSASLAPAMISFGYVSPDEAKKHGLQIRYRAAGPKDVWVELSFDTDGKWKPFAEPHRLHYIEFYLMTPKDELGIRTRLREYRDTPGKVSLSFTVDRSLLHRVSIWLTRRPADVADVVQMRDYIALDSIGKDLRDAP